MNQVNDEIKNPKLMEEVKEFVKTKIQNITCVDEIFVSGRFSITNLAYPKDMNIYKVLVTLKKILQITLNLYNDYEKYQNFIVKFSSADDNLSSFCQPFYRCENGVWECYKKPNSENVIDALYRYLECLLSISKVTNSATDSTKNIEMVIDKCTFCNDKLSPNDVVCGVCFATIDEIRAMYTKNNPPIVLDNDIDEVIQHRNMEFGDTRKEEEENMSEKYKIDDVNQREMNKSQTDHPNEIIPKWKCGKCECLNAYINANCVACGALYAEGTWTCNQCTMGNNCVDDKCTTCATVNIYAANATMDNMAAGGEGGVNNELLKRDGWTCDKCGLFVEGGMKECQRCVSVTNFRIDQWECGKCSIRHPYSESICDGCGASRIGSGRWRCSQCTLVNKCIDTKCKVCGMENKYLTNKYCDKCKINIVNERNQYCDDCARYSNNKYKPTKWQCRYPKCNEYNTEVEEYCHMCRLQRDYFRARGDNVKLWHENVEKLIWICHKCSKINKQKELVCYDCKETRFKQRYCKDCKVYNDGTTTNCDICHQKL